MKVRTEQQPTGLVFSMDTKHPATCSFPLAATSVSEILTIRPIETPLGVQIINHRQENIVNFTPSNKPDGSINTRPVYDLTVIEYKGQTLGFQLKIYPQFNPNNPCLNSLSERGKRIILEKAESCSPECIISSTDGLVFNIKGEKVFELRKGESGPRLLRYPDRNNPSAEKQNLAWLTDVITIGDQDFFFKIGLRIKLTSFDELIKTLLKQIKTNQLEKGIRKLVDPYLIITKDLLLPITEE